MTTATTTRPFRPSRQQLEALAAQPLGREFRTWSVAFREWLVAGGYVTAATAGWNNRLTRTGVPVPQLRPYRSRAGGPFPWSAHEHWKHVQASGYHMQRNVLRMLRGGKDDWQEAFELEVRHPHVIRTKTALTRTRKALLNVLAGKPPSVWPRAPRFLPLRLRRDYYTGRNIRWLCCELLLEPKFEAGTCVGFTAMDPNVAASELRALAGPGMTPLERYQHFMNPNPTNHG